jgi:predicted HAD superfamily Cof-like phosphohydrolase
MKKQLESVRQFHKIYKLAVSEKPTILIPKEQPILRYDLMAEENKEYLEAAQNNDLIAVADALGDMLYVLCGTILEHGLQHKIEAIFDEIHRSNMSKLDAKGKPIYREDGKVIKGPNYSEPNLFAILEP